MRLLILVASVVSLSAVARPVTKTVAYEAGAAKLEGVLLFDDEAKALRPGLVLVPNWMGITPANLKQAQELAGTRYVVFVADMYGKAVRPKNPEEAGKAATAVKGDRKLMRERANAALTQLLAQGKAAPLDVTRVGAVGFCFGGTSVLELARSGAKVAGVVSIHGGLDTPNVEDAKAIKGRVLALHGADDPAVPPEQVKAFEDELRKAGVDWEVVAYGGAVHSFTDPDANTPGRSQYHPKAARRAFARLHDFFTEAFGG